MTLTQIYFSRKIGISNGTEKQGGRDEISDQNVGRWQPAN
jgi:hypothetical protein